MLTTKEQEQILRAAQVMAKAARRTERLRQMRAIPVSKHAPEYVEAQSRLADLLKEVG